MNFTFVGSFTPQIFSILFTCTNQIKEITLENIKYKKKENKKERKCSLLSLLRSFLVRFQLIRILGVKMSNCQRAVMILAFQAWLIHQNHVRRK